MTQKDLFGNEMPKPESSTKLEIKPQKQAGLTKGQKAFISLTKSIEKLHLEIQNRSKGVEECLKIFGKRIVPLETELARLRVELINVLYPFLNNGTKLLKKDREIVKDLIWDFIQYVTDRDPSLEDRFPDMLADLGGMTDEEAQKAAEEMEGDQLRNFFSFMGMDIDLDDIDMTDQGQVRQRMSEAKAEYDAKQRERQHKRKKSKRELEAEAKEAAIKKPGSRTSEPYLKA